MKKLLLTTMIASMLILPFGTVALADDQEASSAPAPVVEYVTGSVPAQNTFTQAIAPTVHAIVLAMNNQGVSQYSPAESSLTWEALYNLLSMYGQMDDRSEYLDGLLVVPSEVVSDFACALMGSPVSPDAIPESLLDRMRYDSDTDSYLLVCGNDSLSEVQFKDSDEETVYGSLVYLVDNTPLSSFCVTVENADNLLGYQITALDLA